mmetsp:Transcript_9618/g.37439  ORF Transcript_9618/g.37439 Transcript_9618/m.37439 type:complete len:383 (-) Transcript_9618:1017-2165(-)
MLAVAWVRRLRLRRSEARSFGVGPAQALGATRGGAGEQRRAWREASPTPVRHGQCVGPPSKRSGRDGSRRISPAGAVGGRWRRTSSRPPIAAAAAAAASVVLLAESARAVCRFRSCSLVARPRASIRGLRLARKRGSALCAVCCAAEAARTVRPHGVRRRGSRCCGLHRSWQARHWRGNGSRQAGSRLHPRVREAGRRPCCLEHGRGGSASARRAGLLVAAAELANGRTSACELRIERNVSPPQVVWVRRSGCQVGDCSDEGCLGGQPNQLWGPAQQRVARNLPQAGAIQSRRGAHPLDKLVGAAVRMRHVGSSLARSHEQERTKDIAKRKHHGCLGAPATRAALRSLGRCWRLRLAATDAVIRERQNRWPCAVANGAAPQG